VLSANSYKSFVGIADLRQYQFPPGTANSCSTFETLVYFPFVFVTFVLPWKRLADASVALISHAAGGVAPISGCACVYGLVVACEI
jgi:hypothetical protein